MPSDIPSDVPSDQPSSLPSSMPSDIPSDVPSDQPSSLPSSMPSDIPSDVPSDQPSSLPSSMPSDIPSDVPSDQPSFLPSSMPSDIPSDVPSDQPSSLPSSMPSDIPSDVPSDQPSSLPSSMPSDIPSDVPSDQPSSLPSSMPSDIPSDVPSDQPSSLPSSMPSDIPSDVPSDQPSSLPSSMPSDIPSDVPSSLPSSMPSDIPSDVPSDQPSSLPSSMPSDIPSDVPSDQPSSLPSSMPSDIPSDVPSDQPSSLPSSMPSDIPSNVPSSMPSDVPSDQPSVAPVSFPEQCNPKNNSPTAPPCFIIPGDNCPDKPPGTCGSTDPCDACPSDSLCQEGTNNDIGEGNFYCVACGCGFYDSSGTQCCKSNGSTANPNCLANGPANSGQCSPDHFGGIPSIDGGANSNICNGTEKLSGSGNSCLMADVNNGCVCVPSTTELCKDPSLADVVCRAFEMVDDGTKPECDACRDCMIAECEQEASGQSLSGDWSTEAKVVETLGNWNDLNCRTDVEVNCASVCAYDPIPSLAPSGKPSTEPSISLMPSLSIAPSSNPSLSSKPSVSIIPSSQPSSQPSIQPSASMAPSSNPSESSRPSTLSGSPSISPTKKNQRNVRVHVEEDSSKRLCIQDEFTEEQHNEDISEGRSNIHVDVVQRAVFAQVDNLIQAGLQLYAERDELATELTHVKEVSDGRLKEIQRLKESEETLRVSMSNLLKAVEASKANARDACRAAQLEAQLRGENANIRSQRDEAIGQKMETERKTQLLNEENRLLKARVARLTQDKIKMEREARASMSLARSLDSHAASDVEYYKRKVADLNDTVHHKNVAIADLKQEIDGYKRQIERSMSQQSRLYRK
ncbi:hypothetical protein CTEN210_14141 [Chaetoceros tenuissimus]|uniref:Uncharacterized protein n=1 Tax=Chaetoceros tenuissimus TaxID=426638 RepID=A0AAD3HBN8_9STRA|nr:hypothetical protein CTEN210_14141 [Chaetoceros tenuissimus]